MTQPMDPTDWDSFDVGESEYGWGAGMFPPGIANGEGQLRHHDDFGENMRPQTNRIGDVTDNYARAVADRRTDSLDPESNRDFEVYGNTDRYGAGPKLVRTDPQPNRRTMDLTPPQSKMERRP